MYWRAFSSKTTQSSPSRPPDGDEAGGESTGGSTDSDSMDSIVVILPCQDQNTTLSRGPDQEREENVGTERRPEERILSAAERGFTAMELFGRSRLRCSARRVVAQSLPHTFTGSKAAGRTWCCLSWRRDSTEPIRSPGRGSTVDPKRHWGQDHPGFHLAIAAFVFEDIRVVFGKCVTARS